MSHLSVPHYNAQKVFGKALRSGVVAQVAAGTPKGCTLLHHLATAHASIGKTHAHRVFKLGTAALAFYSVYNSHSAAVILPRFWP